MEPMTGRSAVKMLEAIKAALDAAGAGEYRALKFLDHLATQGLDVVEVPPARDAMERLI